MFSVLVLEVSTFIGMSKVVIKCRKCRHILFVHPDTPVENAHGQPITSHIDGAFNLDNELCENTVWYLKEDCLPDWIERRVSEISWLKGKLHCTNCSARIGSLDFVSGSKCPCERSLLSPIQLVKSKLDFTRQDTLDSVTSPQS